MPVTGQDTSFCNAAVGVAFRKRTRKHGFQTKRAEPFNSGSQAALSRGRKAISMADDKTELTLENITALLDARLAEVTNGYDKKLEKHVNKTISPIIDDLKGQITKGLKPKKLAKLMRRMEEAKEGKTEKKNKETAKTPAEIEVERLAAEALAAKDKGKNNKDRDRDDYFKKQRITEFEDRIKALEGENTKAAAIAEEATRMSALDRALSDLPWASLESRDMARDYYAPKLKRNDEGDLVIGDRPFTDHIKAEIPAKFENLLAPANKGGSGLRKGSEKPGAVDVDALTSPTATAEQKNEASRHLAKLLGA
jgi:uncharacterized FlaG/YvyC family protein